MPGWLDRATPSVYMRAYKNLTRRRATRRRGSACSAAYRAALQTRAPLTGGAKADGVRHLASPVSPSIIKSQEPKVFCLTPDSIRAIFRIQAEHVCRKREPRAWCAAKAVA